MDMTHSWCKSLSWQRLMVNKMNIMQRENGINEAEQTACFY
ncbi:hypothetical protein AOT82_283 [Psychrobacter sp. AntiMn-1]|nr:hypothetical protein AOT82_283 [Psychrobacter sp. AntiMn-1]